MKLVSKVTEIYCITDDFCKEYELELNKKHFRFQIPLQTPLKLAIEREEWATQKWLPSCLVSQQHISQNQTFLSLLHLSRTKRRDPHLLSYTRFVERMPRVAIPLLLFLKLALMGECTGITFINSTRFSCVKTSVSILK